MTAEQEIAELESILHNYTVFFLIFDVIFFTMLACTLILAVRYIRNKKSLHESNEYLSYTIRGQEEERSRIARELHDTIAQDIRYCKGLSESKDSGNAEKKLSQIAELLGKSLQEIRSISYNLAPPDLIKNNLINNILNLCSEFSAKSGIEFRFTVLDGTNTSFLTADESLNLYRIVQESLNNIFKHAHATEATVLLRNETGIEEKGLYIFVTDDGKGFDTSREDIFSSKNHFGLTGMKKRTALIGAKLSIDSAVNEGTQVSIMINNSNKAKAIHLNREGLK